MDAAEGATGASNDLSPLPLLAQTLFTFRVHYHTLDSPCVSARQSSASGVSKLHSAFPLAPSLWAPHHFNAHSDDTPEMPY